MDSLMLSAISAVMLSAIFGNNLRCNRYSNALIITSEMLNSISQVSIITRRNLIAIGLKYSKYSKCCLTIGLGLNGSTLPFLRIKLKSASFGELDSRLKIDSLLKVIKSAILKHS